MSFLAESPRLAEEALVSVLLCRSISPGHVAFVSVVVVCPDDRAVVSWSRHAVTAFALLLFILVVYTKNSVL